MCLAALALGVHADLPVVIIANRDEFLNRPAMEMAWWENSNILAGKDLLGGGTWLGLTDTGRFAMLTNVRNPELQAGPNAPSRGQLVTDYLINERLPAQELDHIMAGYNLIYGDLISGQLEYQSNQFERLHGMRFPPTRLSRGIYTLSNASLTSVWPKTNLLATLLAHVLSKEKQPTHRMLLALLQDTSVAADDDLPNTGVPRDWEKMLSAIKIISPFYGTRCSTVITVDKHGEITVTELSYSTEGDMGAQVTFTLH